MLLSQRLLKLPLEARPQRRLAGALRLADPQLRLLDAPRRLRVLLSQRLLKLFPEVRGKACLLTAQFGQQAAVNLIKPPLRQSRCRHPQCHFRKQNGLTPYATPLSEKPLITQAGTAVRHAQ